MYEVVTKYHSGRVLESWSNYDSLDQALKAAYSRWRERHELNANIFIRGMNENILYSPRQLTAYFKKNILLYI